jgi:hypothetical protein
MVLVGYDNVLEYRNQAGEAIAASAHVHVSSPHTPASLGMVLRRKFPVGGVPERGDEIRSFVAVSM